LNKVDSAGIEYHTSIVPVTKLVDSFLDPAGIDYYPSMGCESNEKWTRQGSNITLR